MKRIMLFLIIFILMASFLIIKSPVKAAQSTIINKETINKIDNFIRENMKKNNIDGVSLAITKDDEVYYSTGYGITKDTLMPIASISKSFTALAVLKLSEEYNIDINQPYISFFPEIITKDKRVKDISIKHLLNHTSGLSDKVNPDMTRRIQFKALNEINKSLEDISLDYSPGTKYNYHNPNYHLLACLVEKVSGLSFNDYLKEKIFLPLGMNNSFTVNTTEEFKNHPEIAKGHYTLFGFNRSIDEPNWFINGAAGIVSNASDMEKWLLEKKEVSILSKEENKVLFRSAGELTPYGMGHSVYDDEKYGKVIRSSGIFWSYKSEQVLFIDKNISITMTFDKGLNIFTNYPFFINDILDIILNDSNNKTVFNNISLEILVILLIILTFIWRILSIKRFSKIRDIKKAKVLIILSGIGLLLFILLFLFFPQIITFVSNGRVIPLKGIWIMMPSVIVLLILNLFSLFINFLYKLYKINKLV